MLYVLPCDACMLVQCPHVHLHLFIYAASSFKQHCKQGDEMGHHTELGVVVVPFESQSASFSQQQHTARQFPDPAAHGRGVRVGVNWWCWQRFF